MTERAEAKITDLSTDRNQLVHFTDVELLPLILRDGLVSIQFARDVLSVDLPQGMKPMVQEILDFEYNIPGFDMISVYDPSREPNILPVLWASAIKSGYDLQYNNQRTTLGILNGTAQEIRHSSDVALFLSGRLRATRKFTEYPAFDLFETLLRRRVAPRDICGVAINPRCAETPMSSTAKRILRENYPDYTNTGDANEGFALRERFLAAPCADGELEALRKDYVTLTEEYKRLARYYGWSEGSEKPLAFCIRYWMKPYTISNMPDRSRRMFIRDDEKSMTNSEHFLAQLENRLEELGELGHIVSLDDFNRICASNKLRTGVGLLPPRPAPEPIEIKPSFFDRIFRRKASEVSAPSVPELTEEQRLNENQAVKEIVAAMENLVRVRRLRYDNTFWIKYIEKTSGKPIHETTIRGFLEGLCKQYGLPLYDFNGKVLWP